MHPEIQIVRLLIRQAGPVQAARIVIYLQIQGMLQRVEQKPQVTLQKAEQKPQAILQKAEQKPQVKQQRQVQIQRRQQEKQQPVPLKPLQLLLQPQLLPQLQLPKRQQEQLLLLPLH